jgi:hypothetical protein
MANLKHPIPAIQPGSALLLLRRQRLHHPARANIVAK